jgi:hypothetical protein
MRGPAQQPRTPFLFPTPGQPPDVEFLPQPNYTAGDEQFLRTDSTMPVQLRPMLRSEDTPGERPLPKGTRMLVHKSERYGELRAIMELPPDQRANTPQNVAKAIERLGAIAPVAAAFFKLAAQQSR